jgi:acyl-CoA synthetase (AMP-forming)/AMP-acid ligase II
MWPAVHARSHPDKAAYVMAGSGEAVTYRELDERSNQLAHVLHDRGLRFRDHIAVFMDNNARYLEVCWAAQRSGYYFTPVNYHFTADEVAYILENCDAKAVVTSAALGAVVADLAAVAPPTVDTRLVVGGDVAGYERYDDLVGAAPTTPLAEELEGHAMMYSSGTTGRPKGIKYPLERKPVGSPAPALAGFQTAYGIGEDTVYLSPAPMYHAAPLQFCIGVTRFGGTNVIMESFDAEEALALIERHRVTHAQFVPTMFVRMLKLPEEVRSRYDVSSLQLAVHAAAPCPVPVKQQMIDWWGPIIFEYYGATEGTGATMITSEEWLAHPGSVGRPYNSTVHILDEEDNELGIGETGVVWFEPGATSLTFEYYKDAEKTASAHNREGWATVGDMGYVDDDGYLYLTDRRDFMIVSGGVNIYPQEAENLLVTHAKVLDVAVFGVPDEEMGEQVKAVVQPIDMADAGDELEQELLAFCREQLAHYKCPKSIDFEAELPRQPTGKLYKRLLRDRYWGDKTSRIV